MAAAALGLVLAGALLLAGPALMQDRLLYFPARTSVAEATAEVNGLLGEARLAYRV